MITMRTIARWSARAAVYQTAVAGSALVIETAVDPQTEQSESYCEVGAIAAGSLISLKLWGYSDRLVDAIADRINVRKVVISEPTK